MFHRNGRVLSAKMCNRSDTPRRPTIGLLLLGFCPVHNTNQCVETFFSMGRLGEFSLREILRLWRSARKERRS